MAMVIAARDENEGSNDKLDYEKLCSVFYDKHTSKLHQRQIALLTKVARVNAKGYRVADLPAIQKVIAAGSMQLGNGHAAFLQPVRKLIALAAKPFIRTKANEELTLGAAVPTIVCELGVQLQSSHLELQVAAAETLHAISTGACLKRANEAKASSQDQRLSPQDYSRQVISRSGVVESATKVLQSLLQLDTAMAETQDDDPEPQIDTIERLEHLLFPIMELMLELSYWAENSRLLTRFGALECIIQILDTVHDLGDDLLPLCVEFLWNVLENGVKIFEELPVAESRHELLDKHRYSNASYALGSEKALETLGNLLILFFRKGYRKQDKELRNELVIVLVQLCRRRENRDVIRTSGLLQTINHYAIAAELGHEEDVHNYTDPCPEDFELKCLLWTFLATSITENGTNMALVSDSCLIQVLLMYILEESTESKIIHQWSNSQLRSLQFVALSTLHQVAVCAPEKFQEQSGHTVLLHVLKMMKNDELCRKASILLCSMCNSEAIQTELGTLGTIETMLDIFADDAMDAELKCNAVCLLSRLCRDHGENQTIFRRADGVLLLQRYLTCDEAQEHNLMIAVIGALWSCVVGNKRSEARFLQMEGVDVLLTILETCPNVMQSQVLGVLSDLLSNPKATMAFQSWKSLMSPNNAFQLLLNAWIEEEKRLNVERPMSGMLSNLMRPLDPTQSHKTQDNDDTTESPAFSRLMEALKAAQEFEPSGVLKEAVQSIDKRVKIYAVLSKVGFQLNREELDLPHQMALEVAKEYPTFLQGQLWLDVKNQIRQDGLRPIFADSLIIENNLEKSYNLAARTKCKQMSLLDTRSEQEGIDEEQFFQRILKQKEQKLQVQLLMKKSKQPKSKMKSRKEAKAKQEEMLRQSLQT